MYIRRKVYSVLTDDYGYERLFSTNDVLLDGYDERYFSDDYAVGRDTGALIGGTAGLAGAAGLGAYAYKNKDKWIKNIEKDLAKKTFEHNKAGAEQLAALGEKYELMKKLRGKEKADITSAGMKDTLKELGIKADNGLWRELNEEELHKLGGAGAVKQEQALKKFIEGRVGKEAAGKYTRADLIKMLNSKQTLSQLEAEERKAIKKAIEEGGENLGKGWKNAAVKAYKGLAPHHKVLAGAAGLAALGYGGAKLGGAIGGAANRRR